MPGPNNSQSITSTKSLLSTQQSGQQLIDGQDILTLNQLSNSGKGGLTALAGGGLSAATPLAPAYINEFTVVASANDSCVVPPAIAGLEVTIINSGAQNLRVYCQNSNPGNGGAADTIIPEAGGAGVAFITVSAAGIAVLSCAMVGRWKSQFQ